MKRLFAIAFMIISMVSISAFSVNAEELAPDMSGIYNSLSDEAKQRLTELGADSPDAAKLSEISFESVMSEIMSIASAETASPLRALITVVAVLLLCSMLSSYKSALSPDMDATINAVSALSLSAVVAVPAAGVIAETENTITIASNLMLAYIPVMAVLMAASGKAFGSTAYYACVLAAGEGVNRICSQVISPFLNMLLGLSITGAVSPNINLKGFIDLITRFSKWLLGFSMAVFTAVLGVRQVLSNSLDGVSTRAVKFALTSFVPVVGSALSEAYKTVQGSVALLRSGVGVFVIFALAVSFLPTIIKCVLWIFCLGTGRALAQALGLNRPASLLGGLGSVFSLITAVLLCVMTVYIISTAIVLVSGGTT